MGNWLTDWWYGFLDRKNKMKKRKLTRSARDFVLSYYNSPGFDERFKNVPNYIKQHRLNYGDLYDPDVRNDNTKYKATGKLPPLLITKYEDYDENSPGIDYGSTAAHEYGHFINDNIHLSYMTPYNEEFLLSTHYSDIFPHFRNSKSYNKVLFSLDPEYWEFYEAHPMTVYNVSDVGHDAAPMESYVDLMAFREALYRFNIYDSRKAKNPFTKEHLDKWKV